MGKKDVLTVHRWPYGKNGTLFTVNEEDDPKDTIFSATSKGVSYLGNLNDFNLDYIENSDEFYKDVPLGNTSIDIYERIALFDQGKELFRNDSPVDFSHYTKEELKEKKLELYASCKEVHYAIFLPERTFGSLFCIPVSNIMYQQYFHIHPDRFDEMLSLALSYSKDHATCCTLARRIYSCNWH